MNKVPVFSTVSKAYGFVLGDFGTVFLIAWLPLLAVTAFNIQFGREALEMAIAGGLSPEAAQGSPMNLLASILGAVASIMVLIALLRVVIFGQRPGGVFYLWFGMTELKLLGAYVLLIVAFIAAVIAISIVLGIAGAAGGGPVVGVGVIVLMFALLWVMLRLSILPATVAAENTMGVERTWALTAGNAMRLFFVFLLVYIPFGIAAIVLLGAVLGGSLPAMPDFVALTAAAENGNAQQADQMQQAVIAWQKGFLQAMLDNWMVVQILGFVLSVVQTALFAGIAGNAYLALAGEPPAK